MTKERFFTWGIIIVLSILLIKTCQTDTDKPQYVEVPAVSGSLPAITKPKPIVQKVPYPVYIKGDTVYRDNPVNQELMDKYLAASDSIQQLLYAGAIEEREYIETSEDSLVLITSNIKTRGELLYLQNSYTLKPRKVEINPKKPLLTLYLGAGIGSDVNFEKPAVKGNLGLQFRGGDIFRISADTEGRFLGEYDIKL